MAASTSRTCSRSASGQSSARLAAGAAVRSLFTTARAAIFSGCFRAAIVIVARRARAAVPPTQRWIRQTGDDRRRLSERVESVGIAQRLTQPAFNGLELCRDLPLAGRNARFESGHHEPRDRIERLVDAVPLVALVPNDGASCSLSISSRSLMDNTSERSRLLCCRMCGKIIERAAVLAQVVPQVLECLEIGIDAARLRIGDEDETVGTGQNELTGSVVVDLPRNREKLQLYPHPPYIGDS